MGSGAKIRKIRRASRARSAGETPFSSCAEELSLPRDLDDVLHFFLPVAEQPDRFPRAREPVGAIALPILTVPVASRDVVRAAFAWNLTVELARLGARTVMMAPRDPATAPL